jgi:hypothetical protein
MQYIDFERLRGINAADFQNRSPYPWINPAGVLTDDGYLALLENLPDVARFEASFGKRRSHGQQSHDRYILNYREDLDVPRPWHDFMAEIQGERYAGFIRRLFDVKTFDLSLHWHYTPKGASVSPHCDARRKLGSHIFYFNTEEDWKPEWGGDTVVMDDQGQFNRTSAPEFSEFHRVIHTEAMGNRSLLFGRTDHAWHGVKEIRCPEGSLRKVFIVVLNRMTAKVRLRRMLGQDADGY